MAQSFSSHEIYETLYQQIMSLQLPPGATLRENALCEQFGVSRTPIRSVLQELRIAGLVEVTPYKSTRVTRLDFDSISQQIYLRVAVETAVLLDYCAIATPEHLARLRARNDALRRMEAQADPDPVAFYALDGRLHECWFLATGKDQLWQLIQSSQNNYARFRMLDLVEARHFNEIITEHDALLQAIERREEKAVVALCRKHLYGGVTRLGEELRTQFADYFVSADPGENTP